MDKKAQGLSISTIILIILGVAVLVVLILGFALGWDKILPWISPPNNVGQVVQQCQNACATNAVYDYCQQSRTVKTENEKIGYVSCNDLANNKENWGFTKCLSASCEVPKKEDVGSLCDKICKAKDATSFCTIKRSYTEDNEELKENSGCLTIRSDPCTVGAKAICDGVANTVTGV